MGINLEYATLLSGLKSAGFLSGGEVIELGAQDISANHAAMAAHLKRMGIAAPDAIRTASELYAAFGYNAYNAIDASGEYGAFVYDLNKNIANAYGFARRYDLVTNLGTIEHCFSIASAFENMHRLCRRGGLMIHAFPSNNNANHGYVVMQPRLFANLAAANHYKIHDFAFTVDYRPELIRFGRDTYPFYDDRDLMCYVVFEKNSDEEFVYPFDDIFDEKSQLSDYAATIKSADFAAYIKGDWTHVQERELKRVPIKRRLNVSFWRRFYKRAINWFGGLY